MMSAKEMFEELGWKKCMKVNAVSFMSVDLGLVLL